MITKPVSTQQTDALIWYTYSGNKKALSNYEQSNIEKDPPSFKAKNVMTDLIVTNLGTDMIRIIFSEISETFK